MPSKVIAVDTSSRPDHRAGCPSRVGGASLRISRRFALFQLDLFELRAVDIAISTDRLCCLDALRWGRADLHTLIPDGDACVRSVIER